MKVPHIITYDLETGGYLSDKLAGLAEIAMIVVDGVTLEELDRYEAIIAPYEVTVENSNGELEKKMTTYSPGALAVNGLTMSQINAGKDAKTVAKEILAFAKKYKHGSKFNSKPILVGHNIQGFDNPFLERFLANFKVKFTDAFNSQFIDTLFFSRLKWSEDGSIVDHKLGTVCKALGSQLFDAHRAMVDVEGNLGVVRAFINALRGETAIKQEKVVRTRTNFRF